MPALPPRQTSTSDYGTILPEETDGHPRDAGWGGVGFLPEKVHTEGGLAPGCTFPVPHEWSREVVEWQREEKSVRRLDDQEGGVLGHPVVEEVGPAQIVVVVTEEDGNVPPAQVSTLVSRPAVQGARDGTKEGPNPVSELRSTGDSRGLRLTRLRGGRGRTPESGVVPLCPRQFPLPVPETGVPSTAYVRARVRIYTVGLCFGPSASACPGGRIRTLRPHYLLRFWSVVLELALPPVLFHRKAVDNLDETPAPPELPRDEWDGDRGSARPEGRVE